MFARDISMLDLRPKFAYSLPPLSVCNCEPTIPLLYLWISYLASLSGLEANGTLIRKQEQLYFSLTVQIEQNAEEGTKGRAAGSSHGG